MALLAALVIFTVIARYCFSLSWKQLAEFNTTLFAFTTFWGMGINVIKDEHVIVGNYSKAELKEKDVVEGISFGPALIVNGEKMITRGDGGWGVGPRTAIGQRKDGTVLFLVIDGRQPGYSVGATLRDIQNIMYEEGAVIAANLDGGSSSTLYYNGKVINKPADLLGERMIPTAFVVK